MNSLTLEKFLNDENFRSLKKIVNDKLSIKYKIFNYSMGETVIEKDTIPGNIFLISSGNARLIDEIDGKKVSLAKFGAGHILGAPSLMSGRPCENFIAVNNLEILAIDEESWINLYQSSKEFKDNCDRYLWPQEIIYLMTEIYRNLALSNISLEDLILKGLNDAIPSEIDKNRIKSEKIKMNRDTYLCSNMGKGNQDCQIVDQFTFELTEMKFRPRLISLSNKITSNLENKINKEETNKNSIKQINDNQTYINNLSKYNPNRIDTSKINLIIKQDKKEQIIACFHMISELLKIPIRKDLIERIVLHIDKNENEFNLKNYAQIASSLGLSVNKSKIFKDDLNRLQVPSLIKWNEVLSIIVSSNANELILASPSEGYIKVNIKDNGNYFDDGIDYLVVEKNRTTPENRFDLTWFLPIINRYKNVLIQVFISSFIVQFFTLANPLIIQVIIDKVINQRSLDTLQVLGIALLILTLLEGVLNSLKTFLFVETTNRIDQKLGSEVIDHLLRLPLEYFDKRAVGELGTRIGELEKIRNFITGRGLSSILDGFYSIIYIFIMLIYSKYLTIVALLVLPIQIGLTVLGAPLFRKQFRTTAEDNSRTQSYLIEILSGIQTVKAQNIETASKWRWQEFYSQFISSSFKKTITGTALNQTSQVLQKISQLLVLWIGASMVLKGELTLGQLIAFRIISGYVTQPILRLTTIWQSVQELKVSFERLGDIINTNKESDEEDKGKLSLPSFKGKIEYNNVSFKFENNTNKVLNNISFEVSKDSFIGIVGKSGSGKSTLMKLLSRLYSPSNGKIMIDDYDIDKVELYSLRRQIGIIPQDPLLFSGTIIENISGDVNDYSEADLIRAAKLSEAHDFIMQMSSGYNSKLGERGASISGGQKQRLAIARTLFMKPKILIFDESTSALDFETERKLISNLHSNLQNTTIFFITHRLSSIIKADKILMMEEGYLSEIGSFDELMQKKGSFYKLYSQQQSKE